MSGMVPRTPGNGPLSDAEASEVVADVREAQAIADEHQWHGGYYCTCGRELNSPRRFTLHVLEFAGVAR